MGQNLLSGHDLRFEVLAILVTFTGFGLLGLYDDILKIFGFAKSGFFGLRRWHKFAIQWGIALVCSSILFFGLKIHFVNLPFIGIWDLGFGYLFVASFIIVAFANAFDITSGLDGLGEGLLLICLLAFVVISATHLDRVLLFFLSLWIGSLIAGIYFYDQSCQIFWAMPRAWLLGRPRPGGTLSGKIIVLFVIGEYFDDGGSSLLQIASKAILKRRIFPIAPIHHWLELLGWEEPKIVARAWLVGLIFAIFGIWLSYL